MATRSTSSRSKASRPSKAEATASHWGMHVFVGLVAIAAGILALAYPDITLLVLGLVFGINLLVWGTFAFAAAFEPGAETVGVVLRVIVGTVAIIAGLVLVVRPSASVLALLLVIAFWFIIAGIGDLVRGLSQSDGRWTAILLGVIGIAAGAIILANPDIGLSTLAILAGIMFIIRGTVEVVAGFELRNARG